MNDVVAGEACLACGARTETGERVELADVWHGTPGTFSYRTCGSCGSLTLDSPRPATGTVDEAYDGYYTHAPRSTAGHVMDVVLLRERRAVRGLRRLLGAEIPGTVLDFGCGAGTELAAIGPGRRVVGVEPDPGAAANARSKGLRVVADVGELDESERFELVTSRHVLEHVDDPAATLTELSALVAPGGRLLAVTPNARSVGRRWFGRCWRGYDAPRHRTVLTPEGVGALTRSAGLSGASVRVTARHSGGVAALSLVATPVGRRLPGRIRYPIARVLGACYGAVAKVVQLVVRDAGDEIVLVVHVPRTAEARPDVSVRSHL